MTVELTVALDASLRADLEAEARLSNQSTAAIAEEAIARYLAAQKRKRDAIRKALFEADEGVFVSKEAVDRWVATWTDEKPLPLPQADVFPTR